MIKLLDCTIRDGGYYTNWDFEKGLVNQYLASMESLPVDYIEIGYRSIPLKNYYGKYFYLPVYEIEDIKKRSSKKLVIILNEKDIRVEHLEELLTPLKGLVDMVRIALDPQYLGRALKLAEGIKKLGFEVGFNVMYMSKWKQFGNFVTDLKNVDAVADYFYMVDSYGGVYPQDVKDTIDLVKSNTSCPVGFHGHNNLELALINSITAMENGAAIIDSTVWGMGRGAGNLKTELMLSVLNSKYGVQVDFNALGNLVNAFDGLLKKYEWGTNLPYMISGSNSLPQKDVMDWVTTRFYSFNSIIRALQNQKADVKDNENLPLFTFDEEVEEVLILGGGSSAGEHAEDILQFIEAKKDMLVINASSKNAGQYKGISNSQIFCLVGSEGHRLERVFENLGDFNGKCVLPPYPRKMGTYVPSIIRDKAYELEKIEFSDKFTDSHTALALQTALSVGAKRVYIIGYDGYMNVPVTSKERILTEENEFLFTSFQEKTGRVLQTLTPSNYKSLQPISLYTILM